MTELSWTKSKEWGSEGLTHRATMDTPGRKVTIAVVSPRKGWWTVRAWIDGDMSLYRETVTLKDAKQQAQDYVDALPPVEHPESDEDAPAELPLVDVAARGARYATQDIAPAVLADLSPEDAAPDVTGILPDGRPFVADMKTDADRLAAYGRVQLAPDVLDQLDPAEAQQLMAELEETFPHLAEWRKKTLGQAARERVGDGFRQAAEAMAAMGPAASEAAASIEAAVALVSRARERVQFRKDTCGCLTPLHTMRCGEGGRPVVVRKADAL